MIGELYGRVRYKSKSHADFLHEKKMFPTILYDRNTLGIKT